MMMIALVVETVLRLQDQAAAIRGSEFELARQAHGAIRRNVRALPAEDAEAVIDGHAAEAVPIADRDGSRGAYFGGWPGVTPGSQIELWAAPEMLGDHRGGIGISHGRRARSHSLLENLEHGSAVRSGIREVETLVDHREIGDDVALDRLHQDRKSVV